MTLIFVHPLEIIWNSSKKANKEKTPVAILKVPYA
jgi:hypothetical protein